MNIPAHFRKTINSWGNSIEIHCMSAIIYSVKCLRLPLLIGSQLTPSALFGLSSAWPPASAGPTSKTGAACCVQKATRLQRWLLVVLEEVNLW